MRLPLIKEQSVLVSVAIITYNHEEYIFEALESVVSQKTDFRFEIIIGDDRSQDKTQDILIKFKEKYSDKINLILRKENIGSINNLEDVIHQCKGKYIAFLEGDDYWTDEFKLQKQVDFLELNEEYIGVAHRHHILHQNYKNKYFELYSTMFSEKKFTFNDFTRYRFQFHMNSLMCRNIFTNEPWKYHDLFHSSKLSMDYTLFLVLLDEGNLYVLKDSMSVYRYVVKVGKDNYYSLVKKDPSKLINDTIKRHEVLIPYFEKRHDMTYIKSFLLVTIAKDSILNRSKNDFCSRYLNAEKSVKMHFWEFVVKNWAIWPIKKMKHLISVITRVGKRKDTVGR